MTVKILLRRGTAAQWTSSNPTLSAGEPGFETDTGKLKIGNGTSNWNSLEYVTSEFDITEFDITDLGDVVITSPVSGQVLKYNGTNWVNAADESGGGEGTTYTVSAETAAGGAAIRLTGSDSSTDNVTIAAGSGISVTRTNQDTITIDNTLPDNNTTYAISAEEETGTIAIRLTGSDASTDEVKFQEGSNVTITRFDENTITISAASSQADFGAISESLIPADNETYDLGSSDFRFRDLYLSGSTINLGGATISTIDGNVALPAGSKIGGINAGTIILKGSVANEAALPTDPAPEIGDAYVVLSPTPAQLYAYDGEDYINLGDFQGPKGDEGEQGIQGDKGDKGDQGDPGVQGLPGIDGRTILSGSVDPGPSDGENGDFYINTASDTLFGPKAAGSWPSGVNLVGPQGEPGEDGLDGSGVPGGGTTGQLLAKASNDEGDVEWVDAPEGGGGTGLGARAVVSGTSSSLTNGQTGPINIADGFKSYALLKVQVDKAAWVRIYVSETARQADASRDEGTDPLPGAGVIAEVITTGSQTILISPATIGFNDESPVDTNIPIRVTNKSGSTGTVTVTLTVIQLEA